MTHPELAKEADGWDPATITSGSGKKLSWKCTKKHTWDAQVSNRALLGSECPYCTRKIVLRGVNDLASEHPELIDECDGWNPADFFSGSNQKKPWVCELGHHWDAKIVERALRNSGCPFCKNSKTLSGFNDLATLHPYLAKEAYGWDPKSVNPGSHKKYKWKCKKGHVWTTSPMHRSRLKSGCGVCANRQVEVGINDLLSQYPEIAEQAYGWNPEEFTSGSHEKKNWKCKLGHSWKASIEDMASRTQLCPFCSNRKLLSGFNDVATKFPELAKEASGWDTKQVHSGSHIKKKWKCIDGHSWVAEVVSRTLLDAGCPYCTNKKVLAGFNDLALTHPLLAAQANGWDPTTVLAGNNNKAEWICESGHVWRSSIVSRSSGIGCPTCAKSGFDPNEEGFLYLIEHNSWEMFQIGITNSPEIRLKTHTNSGWEVLELRGPMDGHLTQDWETAILRMLKANGADLSNSKIAGKFDGYSEAWSKSTFEAKSIKELMKLTEEFEEKSK